jgi:hypothetical protein
MKKIALVITAIAWIGMTLPTVAQQPTMQMFDKYGSEEGFTVVSINKDLFTLLAEIARETEDEEIGQVKDVIKDLDNIRILMYNAKTGTDPEFLPAFKEELSNLKMTNFSELMTVKEQDELVRFLIRKEGDKIHELLLIVDQADQAGFVSISGIIDLKSIAKISRTMNLQGLENLEKMNQE